MKYLLILFILLSGMACFSNKKTIEEKENSIQNTAVETKRLELSENDTAIIEAYNEKVDKFDFNDNEAYKKMLKESLKDISRIENIYERQRIQYDIYIALSMYGEAYLLSKKNLDDSFSLGRLLDHCNLIFYAKRGRNEYEQCNAKLASLYENMLNETNKKDLEYQYNYWGYVLFTYKSGNHAYKEKLIEFISKVEDEQTHFQLQGSYELAVEQVESYK